MAFPHKAESHRHPKPHCITRMILRAILLLPLLTIVQSEPDALIRFADGSVVEIENRPQRINAGELVSSSSQPSSTRALLSSTNGGSAASSPHRQLASHSSNSALLSDTTHRVESRSPKQHYCGEVLVNALSVVCKGLYNNKRARLPVSSSTGSSYEFDLPYGSGKSESDISWPEFFEILKNANTHRENSNRVPMMLTPGNSYPTMMGDGEQQSGPHQSGNSIMRAAKRGPNFGVVDECCKKPCTFSTLALYCSL